MLPSSYYNILASLRSASPSGCFADLLLRGPFSSQTCFFADPSLRLQKRAKMFRESIKTSEYHRVPKYITYFNPLRFHYTTFLDHEHISHAEVHARPPGSWHTVLRPPPQKEPHSTHAYILVGANIFFYLPFPRENSVYPQGKKCPHY